MKVSIKRFIALLLVVASVLGVTPSVFAVDSTSESGEAGATTEPTVETETTAATEAERELSPEEYIAELASMESPLNVSFSLHLNTIF